MGAVGTDEIAELETFLRTGPGPAVGTAAAIVGEHRIESCEPALVAAFERLTERPIQRDPGCLGKAASAEALHQLDAAQPAVYLAGISTRQMEPVWGGQQDTATELRSACARGLVRMRHPDVLLHLAEALADPEVPVRLSAAQSLAYHGAPGGLPLLRLKVLSGDPETQVIGECLLAMLRIDAESSLMFVAEQLDAADPERSEAAALALGESRAEGAFAILREWLPEASAERQADVALLAIATLRSDDAIGFLLQQIADARGPEARAALAAMEIHRHDPALRERIEAAAKHNDADLTREIAELFLR